MRTSIGLAAAMGVGVRVTDIRAGRQQPGLRAQHLAAVRATAAICDGELSGDQIGSGEIIFRPGEVRSGRYRFDIGTAGSATLLLQTIIPALMLCGGDSDVTVTGGTHNPMAPCFEYLRDVFAPLASAANLQSYFELKRAGFYPAGGGEIHMQIRGLGGVENVAPLKFLSRGQLRHIEGVSAASSSLPSHIVDRQVSQALGRLASVGHRATMEQATWESSSPGTVVFFRAVFSRTVAGAFSLGAKGKPAEKVADEAVEQLGEFMDSAGVIDPHAADQLITIAAICSAESSFVTQRVTEHLLTNAEVIRQLTGREVTIDAKVPATVVVGRN